MMINKNYLIQNAQVGLSSDVQMERQSEHRATLSNSPATFGAPMRSARPWHRTQFLCSAFIAAVVHFIEDSAGDQDAHPHRLSAIRALRRMEL